MHVLAVLVFPEFHKKKEAKTDTYGYDHRKREYAAGLHREAVPGLFCTDL